MSLQIRDTFIHRYARVKGHKHTPNGTRFISFPESEIRMDTQRVKDYLTEHPSATVAAIVGGLGINKNRVYTALEALQCTSRKDGKYSLWSLPQTDEQRDQTRAKIEKHLTAIQDLLTRL